MAVKKASDRVKALATKIGKGDAPHAIDEDTLRNSVNDGGLTDDEAAELRSFMAEIGGAGE